MRRPRSGESVTEEILSRIRNGSLRPGDRLPSERVLAAELGVSRSGVREGLRGLVAMKLVEIRPGSGAYVAALDMASLLEPLHVAMSLGPKTLRSLIEARLVIEPPIAALAAQRASAEDIDQLHALVHGSHEWVAHPEKFLDVDIRIHDAIVQMTRNAVLINVAGAMDRLARVQREFTNPDPAMRSDASDDHELIFEAIAAHDSERAYRAMQEHLQHVRTRLFAQQRSKLPSARVIGGDGSEGMIANVGDNDRHEQEQS